MPALLAQGHEVRAIVHDSAKEEIALGNGSTEVVRADLADPTSLDEALDGVFLTTPAFHPDATALGLNMVEAAKRATVSKIVYNGVHHPSSDLLTHLTTRPVEHALCSSNLDFTVLQPAMYTPAHHPVHDRPGLPGDHPSDHQKGSASGIDHSLIPLSVNEIRRLWNRIVDRATHTVDHVLHRSAWRRSRRTSWPLSPGPPLTPTYGYARSTPCDEPATESS